MREGQAKQEQEFPFNVHIYSHSIAGKTISEARFYNWLVEGSTRGVTLFLVAVETDALISTQT